MNKLKDLIKSLQNDEEIIRFKQLEYIIDHNEKIQADFNKLLTLQKQMVQDEYKDSKNLETSKKAYEQQKEKLLDHLIIDEYLELQSNINEDLKLLKSIIEQEISIDFD